MTAAKRLGSTIFTDNDPLDDLRPTKQRKFAVAESPQVVEPQPVPVAEPTVDRAPETVVVPIENTDTQSVELNEPVATTPEVMRPKAKREAQNSREEEPTLGKVRFSANVAVSTKQKVENASYWIPGMTISALTEVALERELRRLEKEYNDGKPFERAGKLKFGRPRAE